MAKKEKYAMPHSARVYFQRMMHRPGIEPGAGRHLLRSGKDLIVMATANFTTKPPMLYDE
jgi:hypothetical protein